MFFKKMKKKKKKIIWNILKGLAILFVIAVLFTILPHLFFNIDTYKVKSEATKENYSRMVAYITVEVMTCIMGDTTTMDGNLTCQDRTADSVIAAAVIATKDVQMNPYELDKSAVTSGGTNTSDSDAGYIRLSVSGVNIIIKTCHTKPCATNANQRSETIAFQ